MEFLSDHRLSVIVFLPGAAGLLLLLLPLNRPAWARWGALTAALADLALALPLVAGFNPGAGFQAVEKVAWIPSFGVAYHLGADGLGLAMVLLTLALAPLAILAPVELPARKPSVYLSFLLFIETALLGVFLSLDLILFYLFWEALLIPAWFLVGLWGGQNRIRAAMKFFVYTLAGSVLMLVGILLLYRQHLEINGFGTFSLPSLVGLPMPGALEGWLFLCFFLAFAVKSPLFPFHGWLADAYVEAPLGGTLLMAGAMAKMGTYGFARFCLPLFPGAAAHFAPIVILLALAGLIYGAFLALAQKNLKRLVAWSSFSHVNFIVMGIFVLNRPGLMGGTVQMVSHGLVTGGLFLVAGVLSARMGKRDLVAMGGMSRKAPLTSGALVFLCLAALGMPGLSSFVGEFLMVSGAFGSRLAYGFVAAAGVALGAWYFLRLAGFALAPGEPASAVTADDPARDYLPALVPLAAAIVWLGIFPGPLIEMVRPALELILAQAGAR